MSVGNKEEANWAAEKMESSWQTSRGRRCRREENASEIEFGEGWEDWEDCWDWDWWFWDWNSWFWDDEEEEEEELRGSSCGDPDPDLLVPEESEEAEDPGVSAVLVSESSAAENSAGDG